MANAEMLRKAIKLALKTGRPLFIWGGIGIGKSSIVKATVAEEGYTPIDVRLSLKDPTDIQGAPMKEQIELSDGQKVWVLQWVKPKWLPRENAKIVIFFDELNLAPPAVQHAAYQLILDRMLDDYKLPENVRIIAAGNRISDKTGVYKLAKALSNRFIHVELDAPTVEDWTQWAMQNSIHPDIIAFLNFRQDYLFKPMDTEAFPTPRTWEFASQLLTQEYPEITAINENVLDEIEFIVSLAVGAAVAKEFAAFLKLRKEYKDVWDVVTGKKPTPTDPGTLMAVIGAIVSRIVREPDQDKITKVLEWTNKLQDEYGFIVVRMLKYSNEKVASKVKASPIWPTLAEKWVKFLT